MAGLAIGEVAGIRLILRQLGIQSSTMDEMGDNSEAKTPYRIIPSKRGLKTQKIIYLLRKRAGRLCLTFLFLAAVFICIAILQERFVRNQVYRTTKRQLLAWATRVENEIGYKNKWDLNGYRNAALFVPSWDVITKDGLILDVEGFVPKLVSKVEQMPESIYAKPTTFVSAVGQTWRLFGRRITGGFVFVGVSPPEDTNFDDAMLVKNAGKFGSTLEEASSVESRQIDFDVDFAVVSSNGLLRNVIGGIPLLVNPQDLPTPADQLGPINNDGISYLVLYHPLRDSRGQTVGEVLVPQEMGLEIEALAAQTRFNYMLAGISFLLAVFAALWLVLGEVIPQTRKVTLEEALRVGESATVEFKSTFHWDVRQAKPIEGRRFDVLKAIAGFLNAKGGTLFIGVAEDETPPKVRGLREDLELLNDSRDRLQRALRDLITARIGSEFAPFISDTLREFDGNLCWEITVEDSHIPAFVRWKAAGESKEQKRFFVREGPKTSDLDNEDTWRYIRNKWG